MDFLIGLSAGVMMATSFFSMLEPSLRYSLQTGYPAFIPLLSGFAFGTITLQFFGWILPESSTSTRICSCCTRRRNESDKTTTQLAIISSSESTLSSSDHQNSLHLINFSNSPSNDTITSAVTSFESESDPNNSSNHFNEISHSSHIPKNVLLLVLAVTIHNIPEGFVQGVSFGSLRGLQSDALTTAFRQSVLLTLAIGIQNIPEGLAISIPLRESGLSRWKSFFIGQLSGFVEVIGSLCGGVAVFLIRTILPYALSFAAGAMIFVILKELIPRSQSHSQTWGIMGTMFGFMLMMFFESLFASSL